MNLESPTGTEVTDGVASGNSLISEPSNNLHLKAIKIKIGFSNVNLKVPYICYGILIPYRTQSLLSLKISFNIQIIITNNRIMINTRSPAIDVIPSSVSTSGVLFGTVWCSTCDDRGNWGFILFSSCRPIEDLKLLTPYQTTIDSRVWKIKWYLYGNVNF